VKNLKIVILGGGTAGWLSALFVRKCLPESNVTLIQNSSIGIIGVGEATTPNIIMFLKWLKIDPLEVIKETGGTIKNGISFENWNGDGEKYFHGFSEKIADFSFGGLWNTDCNDFFLKELVNKNKNFKDYLYCTKLSYENKVDLSNINYALHFDTNLFSNFLQKTGKNRNIQIIEGDYSHVTNDKNNNIESIHLKDGRVFDTDFVFDCSGFSRLLINKHYKEKWISFGESLPIKKAIPFWIDADEEIPPYTSAIAMKYGWMWKIPLQHRYGCGYVFDTDFIDENVAKREVEELIGKKIDVRKIINFDAGRHENYWVNNCLSVGLASSFIEPLESTSIFLSIEVLNTFKHFINEIGVYRKSSIKLFNKMVTDSMDNTLNFVYLHYLSKRNDTEFWKTFKQKYKTPEKFKETLELLRENNLRNFNLESHPFNSLSFIQVCEGLKISDKKIIVDNNNNIFPTIEMYKDVIDKLCVQQFNQRTFLNMLK